MLLVFGSGGFVGFRVLGVDVGLGVGLRGIVILLMALSHLLETLKLRVLRYIFSYVGLCEHKHLFLGDFGLWS